MTTLTTAVRLSNEDVRCADYEQLLQWAVEAEDNADWSDIYRENLKKINREIYRREHYGDY